MLTVKRASAPAQAKLVTEPIVDEPIFSADFTPTRIDGIPSETHTKKNGSRFYFLNACPSNNYTYLHPPPRAVYVIISKERNI